MSFVRIWLDGADRLTVGKMPAEPVDLAPAGGK
jgi:hypothetical protein